MFRCCLRVFALSFLLATPAFAQIGGNPIEVSGQVGWSSPDARAFVKSGIAYGGSLGWRAQDWLTLEAQTYFAPSKADTLPEQNHDFFGYGIDGRLNLRGPVSRTMPYLLVGLMAGKSSTTGSPPDQLVRGAPSLGLGTLINLGNQRAYLRLQIRDTFFRQRDAKEFDNDFTLMAGIHWVFGGKERDTDLDGVREWLDQCPQTPIGAKVNAQGCPLDSDGDGVYDGLDKCPNTAKGCKVDKSGCPVDSDGDGVCDGVDQCPDTPKGESVDEKGCPNDTDHDGVPTPIDQCPDTPAGCKVDAKGCSIDSDGDGVCDGLDKCPDTPAGFKVNAEGCPVDVMAKESELLDTGRIRLQNVEFESGKSDLLPQDFAALDVVGQVFRQWPQLKIEIGGHTDSRGNAKANQKLSEARATSVRDYLANKVPGLKADQFTVKGYGSTKPVVPGTSEASMAKNRRIEFVVLNRDVLKSEMQRRKSAPK